MDCLLIILEVFIDVIQIITIILQGTEQFTSEIRHATRSGLMIKHVGVDIWNSIPEIARWSENLMLFKARTKNHFLNKL